MVSNGPPVRLSPETQRRLEIIFPVDTRAQAEYLLTTECGNNLPFMEHQDSLGLERIRFAALKVSEGRLERLEEAVRLAQIDWRDLLVEAGFEQDVRAHLNWLPR